MMGIAVVASAMEPMVRNTTVVSLRLPRDYVPAIFPTKPIDEDLQVGVVLPKFDPGHNATWTVPVSWIGRVDPDTHIENRAPFEVDRVIVNTAEPVIAVMPKLIRQLFPRFTILESTDCPTCDLIFVVDAASVTVANSQNILLRFRVTIQINVVTPAGTNVTSFSGEGTGKEAKSMYWSTQTQVRGMGGTALRDAMDRLFVALTVDPSLGAFVREKSAARARPSDLETTAKFDDETSLFPNGRLDAGEQAWLHFTVRNNGIGPAFAVRLHAGTPPAKITLPQMDAEIGDILPGQTKTAQLALVGAIDVETAHEQLAVETVERRGFGGRPVIVQIATERLQRPTLEIADIRLEDHGDRARADRDGRPSNGETLEAVILVRNSGPGGAAGAEVTLGSSAGFELVEPPVSVGAIAPNAVRELRALVRIPTTFDGPDVGLTAHVVETRGAAVATAEKEQRWPLETKRPRIEIGFRLFDGNSSRSSGNRDGVANSGETIEVALIPTNRGKLPARLLRLELTSPVAGLGIKPTALDLGNLPAFAEGTEQRVQITIPRIVDREDLMQRLPLDVAISQTDFPAASQTIGLPFRAQRPQLVAAIINPAALIEGKPAVFTVDVRNEGLLAAEDVKLVIHSANEAVELLDDSGMAARVLRIDLGSIPAKTSVSRTQVHAFIRRNASDLGGSLNATVLQRDFGAIDAHASLTILKETPALISTVPSPALPQLPPLRTAGVPATVSFLRYRDGSRFHDETIQLAFEVQSQAPLELVRLEQNHRVVELPDTPAIRSAETYLSQYDVPVQLEYGANEFEVVAITTEGASNRRSVTLHREKPRGRIWLAVIGISDYRDPTLVDLDFAREDAVAVGALYRQLGIPNEQIIELLDENATLANIKRTLGTDLVKNAANPDDMVLIYFAGHGEREADRSTADSDGYSKYFLPHDASPGNLFGSALSMEEVSRILQRLRAERVVLIIDSCFSGAAGGRTPYEPNNASRGVITAEFLSRMASTGKGRVILTASDSHEVARESTEMRHGVFTYFLLEGLRGDADVDNDGRVDVDEIYRYVSQKVSDASHGMQNPMRKSPNLTGTLVMGGRLQ